jgi:hypothetical protein
MKVRHRNFLLCDIFFLLYEKAKLIYAVQNQEDNYSWCEAVTGRGQQGGFGKDDNVFLPDLC